MTVRVETWNFGRYDQFLFVSEVEYVEDPATGDRVRACRVCGEPVTMVYRTKHCSEECAKEFRGVLNEWFWRPTRGRVLERDGHECVRCGSEEDLEVDHIRPVREAPWLEFEESNLQTLCRECHRKYGGDMDLRESPGVSELTDYGVG